MEIKIISLSFIVIVKYYSNIFAAMFNVISKIYIKVLSLYNNRWVGFMYQRGCLYICKSIAFWRINLMFAPFEKVSSKDSVNISRSLFISYSKTYLSLYRVLNWATIHEEEIRNQCHNECFVCRPMSNEVYRNIQDT